MYCPNKTSSSNMYAHFLHTWWCVCTSYACTYLLGISALFFSPYLYCQTLRHSAASQARYAAAGRRNATNTVRVRVTIISPLLELIFLPKIEPADESINHVPHIRALIHTSTESFSNCACRG
jgi:hypothetical protein